MGVEASVMGIPWEWKQISQESHGDGKKLEHDSRGNVVVRESYKYTL